jgi:predicted extracellular nuclease
MIDIDDVSAGAFVRAKRRAQAAFIAELVQEYQSAGEQVIVMGDFNAFEFNDGYVDVMGTIAGSPASSNQVLLASSDVVNPNLINLIEALPSSERYSYMFDGNAQALDHILVSQGLQPRVREFLYVRNNADFPETERNNTDSPIDSPTTIQSWFTCSSANWPKSHQSTGAQRQ